MREAKNLKPWPLTTKSNQLNRELMGTLVQNLKGFSRQHVNDGKRVLWGHSELNLLPRTSNQLIFVSKRTIVPTLHRFPGGVTEISRSQGKTQRFVKSQRSWPWTTKVSSVHPCVKLNVCPTCEGIPLKVSLKVDGAEAWKCSYMLQHTGLDQGDEVEVKQRKKETEEVTSSAHYHSKRSRWLKLEQITTIRQRAIHSTLKYEEWSRTQINTTTISESS